MSGIYGNHPEDKHYEKKLDKHLSQSEPAYMVDELSDIGGKVRVDIGRETYYANFIFEDSCMTVDSSDFYDNDLVLDFLLNQSEVVAKMDQATARMSD